MAVVGKVSSIRLPNGNEYEILDKDAALAKTPTDISATEETFVYQKSSGGSCKYLTSIKGKTIAWNQLVGNGDFSNGTTGWFVYSGTGSVSGGVLTVTDAVGRNGVKMSTPLSLVSDHKYYYHFYCKTSVELGFYLVTNSVKVSPTDSFVKVSGITQPQTSGHMGDFYPNTAGETGTFSLKDVRVTDLTAMFGAGNEPSTVAEFEALYPELDYPHNSGALRNNDAAALLTDGRNQWDEEWEVGSYNADGQPIPSANTIRSKNYIPVFPGQSYYGRSPEGIAGYWYDADHNFIGGPSGLGSQIAVAPVNARYLRIRCSSDYRIVYNHDICINLSDPSFNGTYEPYWQRVLALRLSELTGIPEGGTEADRVTMFPNGLGGAGSAFDSIFVENGVTKARKTMVRLTFNNSFTKSSSAEGNVYISSNFGAKNLSENNVITPKVWDYTSSWYTSMPNKTMRIVNGQFVVRDDDYATAEAFNAAMNGGGIVAEASTPIVYTDLQYADGTPFTMPATILVDNYGTERIQAPEGATTPSAPFCCDSFYATISAESIIDSLDIVKKRMVLGPAESTDGHVVVFNGEGGKSVKDSGLTIATSVPSGAVFTDTHRPIKVNSTQLLGDNATPVNFVAAGSATVVGEGDTITIASPPNRAAASGGTDTSVVTTGDKYTWNNKYAKPSDGIPKTDLASDVQTSLGNADTALQTHQSAFAAVSVYDTYINASQPGDSIAILSGNNVTITPDAANKRITISATDTNTHRTIEVGGQQVLGNNTTPLNFLGGGGVDISYDAADGMQITGPGSKSSSSGSNELSMVTRGEKYTWNNKMSSGDIIRSTKVNYLTVSTYAATISNSEQATVIIGNQPATGQARSITLPGQPGDGRCFRFYHIQGNPTFYAEQVTTAYGAGRATFKLFRSDVQVVSDNESFSVNDKGLVVEFVFCQSMGNFGTWLVHHSMIY